MSLEKGESQVEKTGQFTGLERVETERKLMTGKEGDNDLTFQNNSAKKVEFSQAVSLTGVESIKRQQQSVGTPKDAIIQAIVQGQMDKERLGSKGETRC